MGSRLKVVIDTNIFINSWFFNDQHSNKIIDLIDNRKLQLLFAQDTIGELIYIVKNFARHHIDDANDRILMLHNVAELFYYSTSVNTSNVEFIGSNDPYDDMFLKCAIKGEADYFISDDFKHGMHNNEDIKVVSSEEFINIYEED